MKNFLKMIRKLWIFLFLILGTGGIKAQNYDIVKFGVFSDGHFSLMHDAKERLSTFIDAMKAESPDFIIELGDFLPPDRKFSDLYAIWSGYPGDKYHVIGNHDTDGGFSSREMLENRGMERSYYSFQKNGFHFIVLDGNDKKSPDAKPYFRFIGQEQTNWLRDDLADAKHPVVIFSHQELFSPEGENNMGIENYREIQEILETHSHNNPNTRVIACFNGHTHFDYVEQINKIWYIHINSMSYNWLGGDFTFNRFGEEVDREFPALKYTAPFKEPLFATVEISKEGYINIKGRTTDWINPDPWDLGYPEKFRRFMRPKISDRYLEFKKLQNKK